MVDCYTVDIEGFVPQARPDALETQVLLEVLNSTIRSPCGGLFFGANTSITVPARRALALNP
jgi:hypothetical protein